MRQCGARGDRINPALAIRPLPAIRISSRHARLIWIEFEEEVKFVQKLELLVEKILLLLQGQIVLLGLCR